MAFKFLKKYIGMIRKLLRYFSLCQVVNPGTLSIFIFNLFNEIINKNTPALIKSIPQFSPNVRYKTILIGMYRANISSNFLDLYLYSALKAAGANVKVLLCDGTTFPCESIESDSNLFNYRCIECKATQQKFFEIIDKNDVIRPKPVPILTNSELTRNAIASAMRFDRTEDYDKTVAVRYQATYNSVKTLLEGDEQFDLVIMSHGMYATWGALRDYCEERRIDYLTWGRTYFDRMISVVKNMTFNEGVNLRYAQMDIDHPEELERLQASMQTRMMTNRAPNDSVDNYTYLHSSNQLTEEVDINEKRTKYSTMISIYLGIPWDGTVYGSNGEFVTQLNLIESIVKAAKEFGDYLFVFRVHPGEFSAREKAADQIRSLSAQLLTNVVILDAQSKVTSYDLIKISDLNMVFSGTLALEIASAGYPLLVCGKNLTSNFEGIRTVSTLQGLLSILRLQQFRDYRPVGTKTLLVNIAKTLYVDDLTENNNFTVTSFNPSSKLVSRIMNDLLC